MDVPNADLTSTLLLFQVLDGTAPRTDSPLRAERHADNRILPRDDGKQLTRDLPDLDLASRLLILGIDFIKIIRPCKRVDSDAFAVWTEDDTTIGGLLRQGADILASAGFPQLQPGAEPHRFRPFHGRQLEVAESRNHRAVGTAGAFGFTGQHVDRPEGVLIPNADTPIRVRGREGLAISTEGEV